MSTVSTGRSCIVCGAPAAPGQPFCATHAAAPAGRKGGWLSAHRRRLAMAEHQTPIDASNVYPRIWVGAAPPIDRRLQHFTLIVLCAREYQPERTPWQGQVVRARLPDDALSRPELREAVVAARAVVDEARRGGRILVTCAQGINRSALVASMAILQLTPRMSADEVIRTMRSRRRPTCLYNPHFREILARLRPPAPIPPT